VKVVDYPLYQRIEEKWSAGETVENARVFLKKFFPGRAIVPGPSQYFRLSQSTLLSVRSVDVGATDLEFYSKVLTDLTTDVSAIFRRIKELALYWVDFVDLQGEAPARKELFGEFLQSGGGLLTLVTFATGVITASLPSGLISGLIVGTAGSLMVLLIGGVLAYLGHGRSKVV